MQVRTTDEQRRTGRVLRAVLWVAPAFWLACDLVGPLGPTVIQALHAQPEPPAPPPSRVPVRPVPSLSPTPPHRRPTRGEEEEAAAARRRQREARAAAEAVLSPWDFAPSASSWR